MPRSKGRIGRPWRRIRATVLAESTTCWLCGHSGADTVDHIVPLSLGGDPLDKGNLAPAHGVHPCHVCGKRCNAARGNRAYTAYMSSRSARSRRW